MYANAIKCGICHKYSADANTNAPGSNVPSSFAAAQPMSGGIAPTTAPTHVFRKCTRLSAVYAPAYSAMFPAPSAVVVSFVAIAKTPTPLTAHAPANAIATPAPHLPLGNGRPAVRRIVPSGARSTT